MPPLPIYNWGVFPYQHNIMGCWLIGYIREGCLNEYPLVVWQRICYSHVQWKYAAKTQSPPGRGAEDVNFVVIMAVWLIYVLMGLVGGAGLGWGHPVLR